MDFKLKTQYMGGEPTKTLAKWTNTVIPAGSFVALSSWLAIVAVDASAKIAYSPYGAPAGVTKVQILEDVKAEFVGDADAGFAVANRGAEVDLIFRPAVFTTGVAEDDFAVWELIENGSFRITIDGTAYNVDGVDFDGDASMADVAATLQAAIRAETSGTETVTFDAVNDVFVISSTTKGVTSQVTNITTSTGTVGTDISWAALLNGAGGSEVSWAQLIDLGASSTDVFVVDTSTKAGVVDSANDITVKINETKYLY
jgi:hypothetical protein